MARPDLARVQRWMQEVVVASAPVPPEAARERILPSRTLRPEERLEIYRGMYPLRMREALESDYPALAHFLGHERFDALACAYVAVHPSRSYTLNRLGDHFPDFVASARDIPRPAFCEELARLEHAVAMVFDAAESAVLTAEAAAGLGERIAERPLVPIEAFRLLSFRYPVNDYLQSVRDDRHDHPPVRLKRSRLAVFRRHYVVRRLELGPEQYTLLEALAGGRTLADAVELTLGSSRRRLAPEEFFRWFREWVGAGIFRAIE